MKKMFTVLLLLLCSVPSRADFWGGDLPLLVQIVTNTMNTLSELRKQTSLLDDQMEGIKDKIYRIQSITEVVQPATWDQWKDPAEAIRRLNRIYQILPKEYRSGKSDAIEDELTKAMNMISRLSPGTHQTFLSGKELEQRGADSSPGVAEKLTASGVGTLIAVSAQTQVIESHITSLLAQMLADSNERESRGLISRGGGFSGMSENLGADDGKFSTHVSPLRMNR